MEFDMKPPIVIKLGGGVVDHLSEFWDQLKCIDSPVVIVHGGGAQSTRLANRLGHTPRIVEGRRITGDLDLKITEWVIAGEINKQLTAEANASGLRAVGFCGVDGATIQVQKREPWRINGEVIDFGWVGEIISIDTSLIGAISHAGFVSIIAPIAADKTGRRFNVNADTAACSLAENLNARELLLVTETGGVLRDLDDPSSLLRSCSPADETTGLAQGWISGGMSVKLQSARHALAGGVSNVWVLGVNDLLDKQNATAVIGEIE